MESSSHNPVIIIGAGVSGLSIASLIVKDGFKVSIFEKSNNVGGRTKSTRFRDHILDNGFHIMPFYKKSAIYDVLKSVNITSKLKLAIVDDIAFFDGSFHTYPKGITDILKMSLIPLRSRFSLLKILLPMAFTNIEKTEELDEIPLTETTKKLDSHSRSFFDAVCMLAFADTTEHISLGEFVRTIIRANPFKGGTSEFAYPDIGGYDQISQVMANYVQENDSTIILNTTIKKILVNNSSVTGVLLSDGRIIESDCVIVSYPHVVFPIGDTYTSKGIFFISNITPSVSPKNEHLIIVGTPVKPEETDSQERIKEIVSNMKKELSEIYPNFHDVLLWERPMAWKLVESVVKEPGLVWKNKMSHSVPQVRGLFFVGDSTISYGIGTDSAAHSAILAHPKILKFLKNTI